MHIVTGTIRVSNPDTFVDQLNTIANRHGCAIQAIDARYVACREQLDRAVAFARRSFERGENVADDLAMEVLLYAAGRRQIERALGIGIGEETTTVVIVVLDENELVSERKSSIETEVAEILTIEDWTPGDRADPELIDDMYDIGPQELAATDAGRCGLVCERVALLEVEK